MTGAERLHPAVQHHLVNSLGWSSLRPLQDAAVGPVLDGAHALLVAPTAGGKTEAAVLPVLSRMLAEDWRGLSVLYICPLKALLNNLEPRLRGYAELLGRRVGVWHGDVSAARRTRLLADPPDLLLTTPESLEVMLVSRRVEHELWFAGLRVVVVDEVHALGGDDRGWHLLFLLERLSRVAGRDLQRIGLSATVSNPDQVLEWLVGSSSAPRRVVEPPPSAMEPPALVLDHVGSVANAARVIAALHRGEKRLVFCDSRSRVEELGGVLRGLGVTTFVTHSSLAADERRRTEAAFVEARDCVIVATSALELGLDVGDLDRVVQVDVPGTVSSILQRLGRTGRRASGVRNCLFLATTPEALLQTAGLVTLLEEGYVEPVTPPPEPLHIVAQQILALCLQEGGIPVGGWSSWFGELPVVASFGGQVEAVAAHMLGRGLLFSDSHLLSMGVQGEATFGWRHFLELLSVFTADPLFGVRHGRQDLGSVHPLSFARRGNERPVLSLGGRSWAVTNIDWGRRLAHVVPTEARGRSRWLGPTVTLSPKVCAAMRGVLLGARPEAELTERAVTALEGLSGDFSWLRPSGTTLVADPEGRWRWWTFGGLRANAALASGLSRAGFECREDNLGITLRDAGFGPDVERSIAALAAADTPPRAIVTDEAVEGLKFSACLPSDVARRVVERRAADDVGVRAVLDGPFRAVSSYRRPAEHT